MLYSKIHNRIVALNDVKVLLHFMLPTEASVAAYKIQGWRQEFSDRGPTLPTRGLNCGFQGIVNAKNVRQNSFSPSERGLACSDRGL